MFKSAVAEGDRGGESVQRLTSGGFPGMVVGQEQRISAEMSEITRCVSFASFDCS